MPRRPVRVETRTDPEIERARSLARVLDNAFIDPLIGFVLPGIGDVAGSMLGLFTVLIAVRRKLSPVVIARMLMNLAFDALLGVVPLLGDLVDIAFKANTKNLALLESREPGAKATRSDWLMVAGAAVVFVACVALSILLVGVLIRALGKLF
ncbi:MAG: DUF4112 domain-containing protein [Kofleriaceae bacterium]